MYEIEQSIDAAIKSVLGRIGYERTGPKSVSVLALHIEEVQNLRREGWTHKDIGKKYGISRSGVSQFIRRHPWLFE
jgi:DNA-binding NarL/FixJ family response regulator